MVRDIQFALNLDTPVHDAAGLQAARARTVGLPASARARRRARRRFKPDVRRAVADIDPDVAVQELYTIPESVDRYQHNIIVVNHTLGGFAVLGLVLAALGLYGVISNLVAQRTGEFGIRLALGAKPRDLLALVLRTGVRLTLLGLADRQRAGLSRSTACLASAMPRMAATIR